ncbi:uncharacterized protein CPUR_08500 [Claviceps purpurea 20.1]|uniref:Uncharacterized protein n=1 Tax=Claviceps purpurea (strain 20.1) TaxID=1111077 RepID=M1VZ32_CLAP2|nr:uncharacterized protein CPUR_08500 [Claviceps purpurea 20.1]
MHYRQWASRIFCHVHGGTACHLQTPPRAQRTS